MPAPTSTTLWRTAPYNFKGYLWFDKPTVVFQCQVNQAITDLDYPIADITWDNTLQGAYTSCWRHMLVLFGSTAGADDLGRGRLRKPPNNNTLFIGRSSKGTQDGTCNISDDTYVTVLDSFLPWARIPYISDGITSVEGTIPAATQMFRDWDLPYTIGVNGAPAVNLGFGPGFASYVDPNTNLLTMSFNAGTYTKGYDGNPSSWLWAVGDGTITVGSTTTPAITVTFPVGRRHIHLTVTQDNAMVTDRHLLVVACQDGGAYEPIKFFDVSSRNLELEGNRNTFNVHVYQDIPQSSYPDKSMVIYWEEEWYGSTKGSINVIGESGQTGCESIKFCGWHYQTDNETTAGPNGTESTVTFNCLDICGWLDHLPGFPIEINRMAAPTSWLQMKTANMDSYFWKGILYYFSTVPAITDFYDTNTGDMYGFARLGSGQKSLYQQIQELADRAIGYELTCNEQGMIYVRPNQNLLPSGSRTSTNIITLNEGDIQSIRHLDVRHPKTHWNRGAAIIASTVDITSIGTPGTAFAVAPGQAPGQGPSATDRNEQLVLSQGELFTRTAGRDAEDNIDVGDIEIEHVYVGDIGLEPVYGQWGTLNIASQYAAQRDIQFSGTRARVLSSQRSMQCSPSGNSKSVKTILRPEVNGVAAVDDTPPVSNVAPEPPVAPPQAPSNSNNIDCNGTNFNFTFNGDCGVVCDGTTIRLIRGIQSGGVSSIPLSVTGLPAATIWDVQPDPYGAFWTTHAGTAPAYALANGGVYYITDLFDCSQSWTLYCALTNLTPITGTEQSPLGPTMRIDHHNQGHVYVIWGRFDVADTKFQSHISALNTVAYTLSSPVVQFEDITTAMDIDQNGNDEMLWMEFHVNSFGNNKLHRILAGVDTVLHSFVWDGVDVQFPAFVQKPQYTLSGAPNTSVGAGEVILVCQAGNDNQQNLAISTDGGATFSSNLGAHPYTNPAPFISSVFSPDNPNIMAIASIPYVISKQVGGAACVTGPCSTREGLWVTPNRGASWRYTGGNIHSTGYTSGYFPVSVNGQYQVYTAGDTLLGYLPSLNGSLQIRTPDWTVAGAMRVFWPLS